MLRVLLSVVVPLLLPTALFFAYAWYVARRARRRGEEVREIDAPWSWLIVTGVGLAVLSVVATYVNDGAAPGGHYVPAHMENGTLVPGRTVP